ncbi:MAG: GGDEF domain-containing protein [Burkholderiaceae bacterium]
MTPLLQYLAEMTAHRDHSLLDVSVVSALHQLTQSSEIRLLEIFQFRGNLYIRPKVWTRAGKVLSAEDEAEPELPKEPLTNYPLLETCIEKRQQSMENTAADGSIVVWFPIWLCEKVIACLELRGPQPFTDEARSVAEGILQVYRNYQSLLDYSERDSLTGLLNRKTFDEKFSKLAFAMSSGDEGMLPKDIDERRGRSESTDQWLAVIDIDHFKKINDELGHLYGDEVLILIANILKSSFRAQDRIFRFGGEEFVILLRSVTLDNARKIFERFRKNVASYPFPQVGKVTVSVGFVGISSNMPVVILGHADQALYHAKTHGRNQVCFYDDLVSLGHLQSETSNSSVEFF